MADFHLTFGQQYPRELHPAWPYAHHDGWVRVVAPDLKTASAAVHEWLGSAWSNLTPAEATTSAELVYPLGELAVLTVDDDGDFTVAVSPAAQARPDDPVGSWRIVVTGRFGDDLAGTLYRGDDPVHSHISSSESWLRHDLYAGALRTGWTGVPEHCRGVPIEQAAPPSPEPVGVDSAAEEVLRTHIPTATAYCAACPGWAPDVHVGSAHHQATILRDLGLLA